MVIYVIMHLICYLPDDIICKKPLPVRHAFRNTNLVACIFSRAEVNAVYRLNALYQFSLVFSFSTILQSEFEWFPLFIMVDALSTPPPPVFIVFSMRSKVEQGFDLPCSPHDLIDINIINFHVL